jgi:hypothetical protein
VRYRWTFDQLAARIESFEAHGSKRKRTAAERDAQGEKIASILAQHWNVDWSDDPIEIIAGVTGVAPEYLAAHAELRNFLRLNPDGRQPGRPREERIPDDEIATLCAEAAGLAADLRETFAQRERLHERTRRHIAEMIAIEQDPFDARLRSLRRRVTKASGCHARSSVSIRTSGRRRAKC